MNFKPELLLLLAAAAAAAEMLIADTAARHRFLPAPCNTILCPGA